MTTEARLKAIDQFVMTPDEPVQVPDPCDASPAQRLRIHVPNVKTTVSLGARADGGAKREVDTGAPNYDGFGVHTKGHVFVNASGGKADSKMSLQANGQILVQSDTDSLYLVSSGPNVLATPQVVNLAGGGGINLAAGFGTNVENPNCDGDAGPSAPEAVSGLPGHLKTIANWWTAVDIGMAAIGLGGSVLQKRYANPEASWIHGLRTAGALSDVGCSVNNVLGLSGTNPADGGVTIHGTAGWLLGTPLYGSAYAGLGLTIGSTFPAVIALLDAAMMAGRSISMVARKEITMTAGDAATLIAQRKVEVASRGSGGVAIKGQKIVLGSAAGAGEQLPTKEVNAFADTIAIAGKANLLMNGQKVTLRGEELGVSVDKLVLGGESGAALQAKDVSVIGKEAVNVTTGKFFMKVGTDSLKLGNVAKPLEDAPAFENPSLAEHIGGHDWSDLKELRTEAEERYLAKSMAWLDAMAPLSHKNCSIELKDGAIKLEVHGFKFKIDSTSTAVGGVLKIKK